MLPLFKTSGLPGAQGIHYEILLTMLCFVRGFTRKIENFRLWHQMHEGEKFDDVVFYNGNDYTFIQLKNKEKNNKKINDSNLFSDNFNNDYNLLKYVKSVVKIMKNKDLQNKIKFAIVYTNIDFELDVWNQLPLKDKRNSWYQGITSIQLKQVTLDTQNVLPHSGKFYSFIQDKNIIQILKRQDTTIENEILKITEEEIQEALKYIVYAVCQPSDDQLKEIIKTDLKEYGGFQNVDDFYNNLEVEMRNWCATKTGPLKTESGELTLQTANSFFQIEIKSIMFDVLPPISSFSGREKELKIIKESLKNNPNIIISQTVQISGLGGIGKTQLTRQFIAKYGKSEFYGRVVWINSENNATVDDSFKRLAETLRLFQNVKEKYTTSLISEVFKYFDGLKVLFVFDNYDKYEIKDDSDDYVTYCQHCVSQLNKESRPYFIFTSRNQNCIPRILKLNLDFFTKEEAENLLNTELEPIFNTNLNKTDIKELAETLEYFPLALQQAIAYIKSKNSGSLEGYYFIKDYLDEFEMKKDKCLEYEFKDDFGSNCVPTLTTFDITFEAIKNDKLNGIMAIQILQFLTYLNADEIDPNMFYVYYGEIEEEQIKNALYLLELYSMIEINKVNEKPKIKIHRLVQTVVQHKNKKNNEEQIIDNTIRLVDPDLYTTYASLQRCDNNYYNNVYWKYMELSNKNFSEQILHLTSIEKSLSNHPSLNKRYKKLFEDINIFETTFYSDDVKNLENLRKTEEYIKDFIYYNIDNIICRNCFNVLRHYIECGLVAINTDDWDEPLLHIAIKERSISIIKLLIEKGAEINAKTEYDETPLHTAAYEPKIDIIRLLIDNGAQVNTKNENDETPLHIVLKNSNDNFRILKRVEIKDKTDYDESPLRSTAFEPIINIIRLLFDNGAEVNAKTENDETPLHIATAIKYGSIDVIKLLIKNGADINAKTKDGKTPLLFAAKHINVDIIQLLLEHGAEVNAKSEDGRTPLHVAVLFSKVEAIKILIEHGAEVNAKTINDQTPLHIATCERSLDVIKLLIENGADIHAKANKNRTLLHFAALNSNIEVVKMCIKNCAEINSKTKDGKTPLHFAVKGMNVEIIQLLIENGAEINAKAENDETPLHNSAAINFSSLDVIKLLIKNGADINAKTKDGKTPLLFAAEHINVDIMQLLLEQGAEINAKTENDETLLHTAATIDFNSMDLIKLLIKNGANINAKTKDGKTPLHFAVIECEMNVEPKIDNIRLLIENGAEINAKTYDGKTPLHFAVKGMNVDIIQLLIENGAEINAKSEDGRTPLHIAAEYGSMDVINLLIQNGADINSKTQDQKTTLHIAISNHKITVEFIKFLIANGGDLNAKSKKDETLLHFAASSAMFYVVQLLIKRGAVINARTVDNITPLHMAVGNSHDNDVIGLLIQEGAEINAKTREGETPLHLAVLNDEYSFYYAKILIKYGADINAKTVDNITPLHMAVGISHDDDVIKLLIKEGAEINAKAREGETPLHLACYNSNVDIIKLLIKTGADINAKTVDNITPLHMAVGVSHDDDVIELLIKEGAEINAKAREGETPLHLAVSNDEYSIDYTKILIKYGADINAKTVDNRTPLHMAVSNSHDDDVIELLIKKGAEINPKTMQGETPLHLACYNSNVDIIKLLIKNGADINAKTVDETTPLHFAVIFPKVDVIKLLIRHGAEINAKTMEGRTALHLVDFNDDDSFDVTNILVKNDANINATTVDGRTPLHVAVLFSKVDVINLLIEHGADINAKTIIGESPLHLAASNLNIDIIKLLIKQGAEINAKTVWSLIPFFLLGFTT